MKNFILIIMIAVAHIHAAAQTSKKPVTIQFEVAGICGMCEKTIESALDAKGIIAAQFDLEKNIATVTYKPTKISEEQIHKLITARGYDTDKFKATDEEYSRTHDCCKYRELEKH